jgi:hypothetical protein
VGIGLPTVQEPTYDRSTDQVEAAAGDFGCHWRRAERTARRALREASTEAVVVLAVDVALLGGLASIDKAKDWES